jgi:hypothetical protein
MRGSVALFCEGEQDESNDSKFYRQLFDNAAFVEELAVQSLGGKEGISAAAEGYLRGKKAYIPTIMLVISDRDFDVAPVFNQTRLQPQIEVKNSKFKVRTGRSCLESYFLEPERVYAYVAITGNLFSREGVETAFENVATEIAAYQSTRWALAEQLRQWFPGENKFRSSWLECDGNLPPHLSIDYCKEQAINYREKLAAQFHALVDIGEVSNKYFAMFSSDEFMREKKYRVWYHGKDLQTALSRKLVGFSFRNFYSWCIDKSVLTDFEDLKHIEEVIVSAN